MKPKLLVRLLLVLATLLTTRLLRVTAAPTDTFIRYVDANAAAGGGGTNWASA